MQIKFVCFCCLQLVASVLWKTLKRRCELVRIMTKLSVIALLFIVVTGLVQSIVNDANLLNHSVNFSTPINIVDSDLMSLSELPLEQLLKIKKSMRELRQAAFLDESQDANDDEEEEEALESRMMDNSPGKSALALTDEHKINRWASGAVNSVPRWLMSCGMCSEGKPDTGWWSTLGTASRARSKRSSRSASRRWLFWPSLVICCAWSFRRSRRNVSRLNRCLVCNLTMPRCKFLTWESDLR